MSRVSITSNRRTRDRITRFAGPAVPPPTPALPAGYVAWYDLSDLSTLTDVGGGEISQVDDKSGNGYHLVQGSAGARPHSGVRTINALDCLDFDGGDRLDSATGPVFVPANGITLAVLFVADTLPASAGLFYVARASASDLNGLEIETRSTRAGFAWGDGRAGTHSTGTYNAQHTGTSILATATTSLLVLTMDNSTGPIFRLNGSPLSPSNYSGSLTIANFLSNLAGNQMVPSMGSRSTAFSAPFNGAIGEAAIYATALTGSDLTDLETYLVGKWTP